MKSQMAFAFAIVYTSLCMHVLCIMQFMLQVFVSFHYLTLDIKNEIQQGALNIYYGMHASVIMHYVFNNHALCTKHCALCMNTYFIRY